jgi:hypothetical protein
VLSGAGHEHNRERAVVSSRPPRNVRALHCFARLSERINIVTGTATTATRIRRIKTRRSPPSLSKSADRSTLASDARKARRIRVAPNAKSKPTTIRTHHSWGVDFDSAQISPKTKQLPKMARQTRVNTESALIHILIRSRHGIERSSNNYIVCIILQRQPVSFRIRPFGIFVFRLENRLISKAYLSSLYQRPPVYTDCIRQLTARPWGCARRGLLC